MGRKLCKSYPNISTVTPKKVTQKLHMGRLKADFRMSMGWRGFQPIEIIRILARPAPIEPATHGLEVA